MLSLTDLIEHPQLGFLLLALVSESSPFPLLRLAYLSHAWHAVVNSYCKARLKARLPDYQPPFGWSWAMANLMPLPNRLAAGRGGVVALGPTGVAWGVPHETSGVSHQHERVAKVNAKEVLALGPLYSVTWHSGEFCFHSTSGKCTSAHLVQPWGILDPLGWYPTGDCVLDRPIVHLSQCIRANVAIDKNGTLLEIGDDVLGNAADCDHKRCMRNAIRKLDVLPALPHATWCPARWTPPNKRYVAVISSEKGTIVRDIHGEVFVAGRMTHKWFGFDGNHECPDLVSTGLKNVVDMSVCEDNFGFAAVCSNGTVFTMGRGTWGRLGQGPTGGSYDFLTPTFVAIPEKPHIVRCHMGPTMLCLIDTEGFLWVCGTLEGNRITDEPRCVRHTAMRFYEAVSTSEEVYALTFPEHLLVRLRWRDLSMATDASPVPTGVPTILGDCIIKDLKPEQEVKPGKRKAPEDDDTCECQVEQREYVCPHPSSTGHCERFVCDVCGEYL
jgi:hypothetical protein